MKYLDIESQAVDTELEALLLHKVIKLAKEAGYTHVRDHWGHNAHDEYTIDEALTRFIPVVEKPPVGWTDDLPF